MGANFDKGKTRGLVIKNTGSWYTVRTDDGQLLDCKIKGNFRLRGIRSTNPVAVGDRVVIEQPSSSTLPPQPSTLNPPPSTLHLHPSTLHPYFITEIEDRRNYIIRKSINLSKQSHILAANVDQAILVVTVSNPQTSTTFIDRFLASSEAYRVPVILAFNKTDLLDDDEQHLQQMMMTLYENIGYQCLPISATTGMGLDQLESLLGGKITLLSGNSGVGKSTLINRLVPGANLRTAELSDAHNMGQHTTTFSEMIELPTQRPSRPTPSPSLVGRGADSFASNVDDRSIYSPPYKGGAGGGSAGGGAGGYLIDTPGIKGFGTFDMEPEEITSYFKEIFHFSKDCRFSNCTHTHEPGCAVLRALDEHYIAQSRYQSYLSMLQDKDESKYREAY